MMIKLISMENIRSKLFFLSLLFALSVTFVWSCKKEDVGDGKIPEIVIIGLNPLYHAVDQPYVDEGAIAYDVVDGDTINLTANIVTTNNVNVNFTGDYTVKYNVTDESGLAAAEKVRVVKVVIGK